MEIWCSEYGAAHGKPDKGMIQAEWPLGLLHSFGFQCPAVTDSSLGKYQRSLMVLCTQTLRKKKTKPGRMVTHDMRKREGCCWPIVLQVSGNYYLMRGRHQRNCFSWWLYTLSYTDVWEKGASVSWQLQIPGISWTAGRSIHSLWTNYSYDEERMVWKNTTQADRNLPASPISYINSHLWWGKRNARQTVSLPCRQHLMSWWGPYELIQSSAASASLCSCNGEQGRESPGLEDSYIYNVVL